MNEDGAVGEAAVTIWPPDCNVVLTGFMGTGKSTVGRRLAARLGYDFVDTDDMIEAEHGSIAAIFETDGEPRFRELEHEVAQRVATYRRTVIATGGRLMLDDRNVAALSRSSRVCCLVASPDEIVERVRSDAGRHDRPLLRVDDPRRRVRELLAERDDGYRRFLRVSADRRSPEAVAAEIIDALAEPRRSAAGDGSGDSPMWVVGAALLTVLPRLVGPVGSVVGAHAATFAPQIDLVEGGRVDGQVVVIGDEDDDSDNGDTVARAAATVATSIPGRAESPDTTAATRSVVFDAAVIQALMPGCEPWTAIMDRLTVLADAASE